MGWRFWSAAQGSSRESGRRWKAVPNTSGASVHTLSVRISDLRRVDAAVRKRFDVDNRPLLSRFFDSRDTLVWE